MGFFSKSGAKEVPQRPYAVIITQYGIEPDWAYQHLKCVEEQDKAKKTKKYRIFDADKIPSGFKVESYASFDAHPDLVMFECSVEDDGKTVVTKKEPAKGAG